MQRIDPLQRAWPLFDPAATRTIEQQALVALAPHTLMRRAGVAVARLALAIAPHARQVWVAAGPGNNGGDGLEAALWLQQAGKAVAVSLLADAARLPADAADALQRAQQAGVPISIGLAGAPVETDLAIDALLGLGGSRAPAGDIAAAIARLNGLACPVLAVDLPSGLDARTGQPIGAQAVRATHTLSLLTLEPGLYTGDGRDHAGSVWLELLAVDTTAQAPSALLAGGPALAAPRSRRHAQHKGSFGDVHVIAGAPGMVGAALLAGRAAHAAGAGRVHLALLDAGAPAHDSVRPELMFRPAWWQRPADELARSTVVCGCGGGDAVQAALPALLAHATRLVLDADGLNAVAADAALRAQLAGRAAQGQRTILTPHPLEAARLLDCSTGEVQADRLAAAARLAERYAAVVVLKGSGSVIAAPAEPLLLNPTGNASLSTAGTGDVLAGWIGGLWAQAPQNTVGEARQAAARAAFQHGLAADRWSRNGTAPLRAADLIERMLTLSLAPPG